MFQSDVEVTVRVLTSANRKVLAASTADVSTRKELPARQISRHVSSPLISTCRRRRRLCFRSSVGKMLLFGITNVTWIWPVECSFMLFSFVQLLLLYVFYSWKMYEILRLKLWIVLTVFLYFAEVEMMKERFAKLLLGEDMSGGGKGVCTALAISNAITNLSG